jgi:hypothetical protein
MSNRMWLLGAADPEMEKIEELLRECGEQYMYALDEHGERVHTGNAYRAAVPDTDINCIYCVECAITGQADDWIAGRIDHHRPGDPGYGRPPSEFLSASSIGQVIAELARCDRLQWERHTEETARDHYCTYSYSYRYEYGKIMWTLEVSTKSDIHTWDESADGMRPAGSCRVGHPTAQCVVVPHEIVFAAAADHCLGAAYQGGCPGVDPDELMKWRVNTRAKFQGRKPEELIADIEAARGILKEAQIVDIGVPTHPCLVRDLRRYHIFAELPEAAAREGLAFLAIVTPREEEKKKVVLQVASADEVKAFFVWAEQAGLVGIYGDPARGFAGGYVEGE